MLGAERGRDVLISLRCRRFVSAPDQFAKR
jgi:hypothetical protein